MAMHTYQCTKCGTTIQHSQSPSGSGCPKGGSHQWNRLTRFIKELFNL